MTSPLWMSRSNGLIVPAWLKPLASMTIGSFRLSPLVSGLMEARSSKSFPIIAATSLTLGRSAISYSPTSCPFRSTVMPSQTAYTCSRKCVTKMMPTPFSFKLRIIVKSFSTSRSSSEEVGSSRMRTLQSISTARAIAIICCSASEYSSRFLVTSMSSSSCFIKAAA